MPQSWREQKFQCCTPLPLCSVLQRWIIQVSYVPLQRVTTERLIPGPNSLFIRVLVDKKFELPYKVVDALVFHFIRLSNSYKAKTRGDSAKLPVLWHQSLLVFAQRYDIPLTPESLTSVHYLQRRYASDLTPDQKDALLDVIRATPHPQISAEIRRELVNSVERGAPRTQPNQDVDMS